MIKPWRPKNWANPYGEFNGAALTQCMGTTPHKMFEAGADAMLEAIKKISFPLKGGRIIYAHALDKDMKETGETRSVPLTFPIQNIYSEFKKNGWLVFIPDEANDESKD